MKELLLQYAAYNVWANKALADTMLPLGDEAQAQELNSSFPSLYATVVHTWSAESIWLQRLQLAEHPVWVQGSFSGSFAEACTGWLAASAALHTFVQQQYNDRAFQHIFEYYDRQKVSHKMPVFQVLQHVFNHSTYHRGQLVTMMRQVGATSVPPTDFIYYAMKKEKAL